MQHETGGAHIWLGTEAHNQRHMKQLLLSLKNFKFSLSLLLNSQCIQFFVDRSHKEDIGMSQ